MDGIIAIFESPGLTNGPSEGINSVIQCAKARAKGFRTIENMIVIVYLMTGDLKALLASPYKTIKLTIWRCPGSETAPPPPRGYRAAPHSKPGRAKNIEYLALICRI